MNFSHVVDEEIFTDNEDLDLETWEDIDVSMWIFRILVVSLLVVLIRLMLNVQSILDDLTSSSGSSYGSMYSSYSGVYRSLTDDQEHNPYVDKLMNWSENTIMGKQMAGIVKIPQYFCKVVLSVVLLPGKFVMMKLVYLFYLVAVLCLIIIGLYWVSYSFLSNTLGGWAVSVLPHPSNLARESVFYVGGSAVSVWTKFTDYIREKIYVMYGNMNQNGQISTPTRSSMAARRKTVIRSSVPFPVRRRDTQMPKPNMNRMQEVPRVHIPPASRMKTSADISPKIGSYQSASIVPTIAATRGLPTIDALRFRLDDADENRPVSRGGLQSKHKIGAGNWVGGNPSTNVQVAVGDTSRIKAKRDLPVEVLAPSRVGLKGAIMRPWQ